MGTLNLDAVRQAKDRLESQNANNSIGWTKLNQGRNVLRILWPKGKRQLFFAEGLLHYGVGPEGKTAVTCPKTFGEHKHCPICEYAKQLQRSKDKKDQDLGARLRCRKREYINVLNRDDEVNPNEPKVLSIGVTVLKSILNVICDPDYGNITDPKDGRDITITKKGQGIKTEYEVVIKPKTSPVTKTVSSEELEDQIAYLEDQMADLEGLFKELPPEELEALIGGDDNSDEDEVLETSKGNAKDSTNNNDYDDMSEEDLKALCEQRGLSVPEKASKFKLILYLTQYDEEHNIETSQREDTDEVMDVIAGAMEYRKNK